MNKLSLCLVTSAKGRRLCCNPL